MGTIEENSQKKSLSTEAPKQSGSATTINILPPTVLESLERLTKKIRQGRATSMEIESLRMLSLAISSTICPDLNTLLTNSITDHLQEEKNFTEKNRRCLSLRNGNNT